MWFFGKKAKKIKEEPKLERQIRLTGQTHTVEDEVLELAYDIDTAFKQVRSHAGEVELVSVYAPDKEHGSEADEPYVAIQDDDVPYCAIDEYNENGTVKDAIELTPLEGKFLFKAKMDYFKELMYFYAFERDEDVFNQAGLCVVYPKSMQGTEDEKELMQLLDRVAESFRSIPQDKGIVMYQTILQECRKWFYNVSSQYDEVLEISIEKDDSSCFIGNIDSNRYISQIVISEWDFKPYRYVEFMIYDLDKDANQSPAFWYGDQDNSSVEDIIDNLNKGLRIVLS